MNKVAIFGATGMTGLCVVKAALEKGLKVQALVRDPSRVPQEYQGKISLIQGDVLNLEDVKKTIDGQDGVIVCLGPHGGPGATTVMTEGMKKIIAAMKDKNVSVVSVCLSVFLFWELDKVPSIYHEITADHQGMYDALKVSGLQWIACNPPHILDQPPTGYVIKHGEVATSGVADSMIVSKYDLGKFFVDSLSMPEHFQKAVGIASKP